MTEPDPQDRYIQTPEKDFTGSVIYLTWQRGTRLQAAAPLPDCRPSRQSCPQTSAPTRKWTFNK